MAKSISPPGEDQLTPPDDLPAVAIASAAGAGTAACAASVERAGGLPKPIEPSDELEITAFDAIVVCGERSADEAQTALVKSALDTGLPVLCVGDGLHALNLAAGGGPARRIEGHSGSGGGPESESQHHRIFISPGSKLAAVVGSGGFVRVNSRHRTGLREADKARTLTASAYGLDDGVIEALESVDDRWTIGVQFHPERRGELPPHFDRLFQSLVERARDSSLRRR